MNPAKCDSVDYIQFLVAAQRRFACSEAARCQPESPQAPAHDAFTRLLRRQPPGTEALWQETQGLVRRLVATWAGTVKTYTLALLLKNMGYGVTVHRGFLEVENRTTDLSVESTLRDISESPRDLSRTSLPGLEERMSEKFHCYLSSDLLYEDAVTSVVDLAAMPQLAEDIVGVDPSRSFKPKAEQSEP